jgi:uncharacterized GH25 family protein
MRKKAILLSLILLFTIIVRAHEFWLQSDKFFYSVGEEMSVSFNVGEQFLGEAWDLKKHRIEKLELHHIRGVTDLKAQLKPAEKIPLKVTFKTQGTQMLVMQSNEAFIELEADKFNEYLKEDGLDNALSQRKKTNSLDKPGREFYARFAKLLIQAGDARDNTYRKQVGLPLEIIPMRNPYTVNVGDPVKFKVLFKGRPLFGAKVVVWNRKGMNVIMQPNYSMQDGTIDVRIGNSGIWMVSVVHMVPSEKEGADWQSYWGSLVFGVE